MFLHRGSKSGVLTNEMNTLIETERKLDELIKSSTLEVHQMCQNKYIQRYPLTDSSVCPLWRRYFAKKKQKNFCLVSFLHKSAALK